MATMKYLGILAASLLLALVAQPASAAYIQIQLGGLDLQYDGSSIYDSGTADPAPLTNATFLSDGVALGPADTSDVTLDLQIPGVLNIPAAGGSVTSASGGNLYLDLGDGEFLSLTLDVANVNYVPLTSTVQFVFAGSAASIDGQQLPYGITLGEPVSVSFSTQLIEPASYVVTQDGSFVGSFDAQGTGEIHAVPEPATLGLLGLGGLAILRRRRR
jgi:hypothetical protein